MKTVRQLCRLIYIYFILARFGVDQLIFRHVRIFYPLRGIVFLNPFYWHSARHLTRGERLRLALENIGPLAVKFGQVLSTRRDLLAADIADELAKLQDRVPPFSSQAARHIIEKAYAQKPDILFKHFVDEPIASASIAQVHAATLISGEEVVIKILRPHIKKQIQRDIALLYFVAAIAGRYWKKRLRVKMKEIVAEFEQTLFDELDLLKEAANASQLKRNFAGSHKLYVPQIYWDYAKPEAIVMERINGIRIDDIEALKKAGTNLKQLAEDGVEIFFTQVFRDNFFHADMHPGNIFVADGQYRVVDFGIMDSLSESDQRYLAQNFLAFFKRDYRRVAVLHLESGWAPANTRVEQLESALRTVCEPIFEKPLAEISFGQLLLQLFRMAKKFNIEIQPQLILLQKTLLNVEGLARQLYPQLDLWQTAKPFLEKWVRQRLGMRAFLKKLRDQAPYWLEKIGQLLENSSIINSSKQ